MSLLPPSAKDELWQLISSLRTNPFAYARILTFGTKHFEKLDLSAENLFETLYSLQVIESLINNEHRV
jgi:hypothetical protein